MAMAAHALAAANEKLRSLALNTKTEAAESIVKSVVDLGFTWTPLMLGFQTNSLSFA